MVWGDHISYIESFPLVMLMPFLSISSRKLEQPSGQELFLLLRTLDLEMEKPQTGH